jgi:cell division septation protein DedD
MVKYLFVFIQTITFFIFNLLAGDITVDIKHNLPASIVVGDEVTVELKINKASLDGFARFQIELPAGLLLKPLENRGGEFGLEENTAKWVWAILPIEEEIILKFSISANEKAIGNKKIRAKFSYLENNVKQNMEMPLHELVVLASKEIAISKLDTINSITLKNKDSLNKINEKLNSISSSNSEPNGIINVVRTLSNSITNNEHIITLKIKKGLTKGFARYSDDMIQGLTAKAIKTDGSTFSVADGKVKFVWVNIPDKEDLEISYSLVGNLISEFIMNGEFSYLENNQSKKYTLAQERIVFNNPIKDTVANLDKKSPPTTENLVKEDPKNKAGKAKEDLNLKAENSANFSIQIGAFTNGKVMANQLQKFKIKETIKSEMQGGFSKFMIGTHNNYKEARLHKDKVVTVNGIKSAFVTAYNEGKRITVQEALMINDQKWFK